ncbi:MAG TPA: LuxR C-terminal-related transcriptional regulator [Pseudonocardiaceae bacterium]|nr:LuxR C-terminal-related transcriptional regulator [Pseudonocardiaceae bacterium]
MEILDERDGAYTFRLTMHPDPQGRVWSWVSARTPDPATHTVRAHRVETGIFKYMNLFWEYTQEPAGVRMRWVQDFELKPAAHTDDAGMTEHPQPQFPDPAGTRQGARGEGSGEPAGALTRSGKFGEMMTEILSDAIDTEAGWAVCAGCRALIYGKRFDRNLGVCPECGHHRSLAAHERIGQLFDAGSVEQLDIAATPYDRLGFVDTKPYRQRLATVDVDRIHQLTDRERKVTVLAAAGLANDDIARELTISAATAKTHVYRAMLKLGARDRAQLVVFAYQSGLVQPS